MNIESELKKSLENKFDIKVNKIEKNIQSTIGNVYIAYSNSNKYVIKIYQDVKHTKAMVNLHRILNKNKLYVPKVLKNNMDEEFTLFSDKYIVVYSFLNGHQITWDVDKIKLTDKEINMIAKTLKTLHSIKNNNNIGLPQLPFENNLKRKSVLHFDLTRNNIFIYNEKNKIGLIDFDDAKFGASICDVSILIGNLFFSKTKGVNLKGMHKFIDEYYLENLKLKEEEVPKIKEFALMWIDYVLNGNEFDTSTTESFEARKKLINIYL